MTSAGTGGKASRRLKGVKDYLKTLPATVANSLIGKIVVVLLSGTLVVTLWEWLQTKHSLQTYGWVWVLGVFALVGLPVGTLRVIERRRQRIQHDKDEDIVVVMDHRLREYDSQKRNEILMDFRVCDIKWHLKRGSAKRLLPSLVEKDTTWHIKNRGDETMTIIREDPRVTILKRLNEA